MNTYPDNEWQEKLKALHPKYFVPEDIKIDEVTFAHDLKGTIEMIEEVIFLQKASLKQKMIDCVPPRAIDEDYGENKPEDKIWGKMNFNACREQILSALNEIDV